MRLLKIMPDYECFPLWMKEGNSPFENVDPTQLSISELASRQLTSFKEQYDQTLNHEYPPDSGFASLNEALEFECQGLDIWQQLLNELGATYEIVYFSVLENNLYADIQQYRNFIAQKQKGY